MTGRPPKSTSEERARVYELADAGLSSRAIADQVYGTPALKDRVLRLLRRRAARTIRGVDVETLSLEELDALVDQMLAELERAGPKAPRPGGHVANPDNVP